MYRFWLCYLLVVHFRFGIMAFVVSRFAAARSFPKIFACFVFVDLNLLSSVMVSV